MKILINYADKQYEPARKWNTLTGRYIARFDKVYEYKASNQIIATYFCFLVTPATR